LGTALKRIEELSTMEAESKVVLQTQKINKQFLEFGYGFEED
jgi:hypothetical protein